MSTTLKFKLGDREFEVRPLTIGQLEDLDVAVTLEDSTDPQENTRRSFRRMRMAIAAAVEEDYPDVTEDVIKKMRVTRDELLGCYISILQFSGLKRRGKDAKPGEGEAPAAAGA